MRAKIKLSLAAIVFVLLFIGVYGFIIQNSPLQDQPHNVTIVIKKDNQGQGVWRVRNDSGIKKVTIYRGYFVTYILQGTDAYFQFPDSTIFEGIGFTASAKDNNFLRLKVRTDAPLGNHVYSVFCTKDSVYGKGNTPPEWEVK